MLVQVLFIHVHLEMDNICIKTWTIGSQKNWCLVVSEERHVMLRKLLHLLPFSSDMSLQPSQCSRVRRPRGDISDEMALDNFSNLNSSK